MYGNQKAKAILHQTAIPHQTQAVAAAGWLEWLLFLFCDEHYSTRMEGNQRSTGRQGQRVLNLSIGIACVLLTQKSRRGRKTEELNIKAGEPFGRDAESKEFVAFPKKILAGLSM